MSGNNSDPPLFDDDPKNDENDDLFSSAIQSPVNGQEARDVKTAPSVFNDPSAALNSSSILPASLSSVSALSIATAPVTFIDPLQEENSNRVTVKDGGVEALANSFSNDLIIDIATSQIPLNLDTGVVQTADSLQPGNLDSITTISSVDSGSASLTARVSNLPPVPSNMYNISSIAGLEDSSSPDLFESCAQDPATNSYFSPVQLNASQEDISANACGIDTEDLLTQHVGASDIASLDVMQLIDDPQPVMMTLGSKAVSGDDMEKEIRDFTEEGDPTFAKIGDNFLKKASSQQPSYFLSDEETDDVPLSGPLRRTTMKASREISLDDDDNLFKGGVIDINSKVSAPRVSGLPSPALPPMGAPLTLPSAPTFNGNQQQSGVTLYGDISTESPTSLPHNATVSASTNPSIGLYSSVQPSVLTPVPSSNAGNDADEFIEVLILEPQRVGEGMNSYMAYKMTTRTNIPYFKKSSWTVTRRFSDYLGLHSKLVEKHLHTGRIIPPAPEKDAINTTKIRLSSSESVEGAAEFLERRRAALQRFMQRTAALPHLRSDPDFREFIELDAELPRATQTSAMSSAGVMRLFNRVGETVNKITFKMEETDQWFEERGQQLDALETELRRLHSALEGLANGRRELASSSSALSKAAAVLSSVEEHSALSRALHQLAEATERTHTVYHAQADADFYILCETTRDYINLLGAVKEVFHERVKVFQAWQYSQTMLAKKRDSKAKLELTARQDKVAQAQQEVQEWEGKVERNQEHFQRISAAIKKELEQFDIARVKDFRSMLVRYLEAMVTSQQQVIKVWESFLPEAQAIS